ncbi:phosphate ABC transporter substrate-binding protein [Allostella humosa]|uniref:PstS family phosphate ABC transporter substrate-binding protein n=1 Tax=Stella humosa TaxID=94 RepID=UPI0011351B1B|nr:substrate-binding domain-containing protein [Stella humosa]BBK30018.1 phosphate ABC transporter substrate-binding protein [Stella humosa]
MRRLGVAIAAACVAVGLAMPATPALANEPIKVVGSTFVSPYLQAVFTKLTEGGVVAPPKMDLKGSERGLAEFCRSAAADSASVLAMSRRMRITEFEQCQRSGVPAIVEIPLGYSTLTLATRRSDTNFELTLQQLYAAVARELPVDGEFSENTNKRWRDIDPALPDTPIRVVLPAPGLGSRGFFEDRFLEAACRGIPAVKLIFSAEERVKQCVQLRKDGAIVEVGVPFDQAIRLAMTDAPPGTIAVVPFNIATAMTDVLKVLPLDGILPSPTTVAARTYPFNRPLFVYVKKAHVKDYRGNGPVAGLRELITELTRERTIGPDGYLTVEGVVPLGDDRRAEERGRALRLAIMER